MASLQCYRSSTQETCEPKCHDNTFGYKVPQMAGMFLKENHHGHEPHANSQGHCYGQSTGHHHPLVKTPSCTECPSQSHGQHAMNHGQSHSHGHNMGQHGSSYGNGMACCHGKTEKKMENKCEHKKKKSYGNRRRDGNGSCSDSGSDSD